MAEVIIVAEVMAEVIIVPVVMAEVMAEVIIVPEVMAVVMAVVIIMPVVMAEVMAEVIIVPVVMAEVIIAAVVMAIQIHLFLINLLEQMAGKIEAIQALLKILIMKLVEAEGKEVFLKRAIYPKMKISNLFLQALMLI